MLYEQVREDTSLNWGHSNFLEPRKIIRFGIMGKSYTFVKNIFRYEKNCHFTTAYRLCIR